MSSYAPVGQRQTLQIHGFEWGATRIVQTVNVTLRPYAEHEGQPFALIAGVWFSLIPNGSHWIARRRVAPGPVLDALTRTTREETTNGDP